jgi:hypothetical protein
VVRTAQIHTKATDPPKVMELLKATVMPGRIKGLAPVRLGWRETQRKACPDPAAGVSL